MQLFCSLAHALYQLFLRTAFVFDSERNLAVGVDIKKLRSRVLKDRADTLRDFIQGQFGDGLVFDTHGAGQRTRIKRGNQSVYQARKGRFSAAGTPA